MRSEVISSSYEFCIPKLVTGTLGALVLGARKDLPKDNSFLLSLCLERQISLVWTNERFSGARHVYSSLFFAFMYSLTLDNSFGSTTFHHYHLRNQGIGVNALPVCVWLWNSRGLDIQDLRIAQDRGQPSGCG